MRISTPFYGVCVLTSFSKMASVHNVVLMVTISLYFYRASAYYSYQTQSVNEKANTKDHVEWLLESTHSSPMPFGNHTILEHFIVPASSMTRSEFRARTRRSLACNSRHRSDATCNTSNLIISIFILLSGDINPNPGPTQTSRRKPKHPCIHCETGVISRSRAISCDLCYNWVHSRCTGFLSNSTYDKLVADNTEFSYICNRCSLTELPFYNQNVIPSSKDYTDVTTTTTPDQFNQPKLHSEASNEQFQCFKQKGLHFIHLNARSLLPKISELRSLAAEAHAAVISVSESWLDDSVPDEEVKIEGYSILRQDRSRCGGGVCAFIRNDLAFNARPDLHNTHLEDIWFELLLPKSKPIVVGTCYRPPNDSEFFEHFEDTLSKIRSDCELMILGDLNVNFLNKNSGLFQKLSNVLNLFNCKQLIDTPTRITCSSSTILDHVICNNKEKICQYGTINIGLSDHLIIYCTRKVVRGQVNRHNVVKMRSLRNYSPASLLLELSNVDWSNVLNCNNVNLAWDNFKSVFLKILDKIAPVKEIRLKNRTEPWMDNSILENIRLRDHLLYKFRKNTANTEIYRSFCKIRNKVHRDIRRAKAEYFSNIIDENKKHPKKLWHQLKSLGYSYKSRVRSKVVLDIDDELCFDSSKVADHFNNFFTSVASKLASKLPTGNNKFDIGSKDFNDYYTNKGFTFNGFKLSPITEEFIFNELCNLNVNKSTGPDNVPARFLKDGATELKTLITHIVNLSISSNTVPDDFKIARVQPIFKKNGRSVVSNFRPISILPIISKLLERAVYVQVEEHFRENNILYDFQSGFRGSFSTDTCLIHLSDHIRTQMSLGNYTGMVLLDLQKAFDTVDHVILCKKLQAMGIGSVEWFQSYLSNRQQIVSVNKAESKPLGLTCGVPQGSLLGPLLFLCYINDMPISVQCKLLLYADDSVLLVSGKDPSDIAESLSTELESCRQWLIDNKLSLHLGKTETILFGTKNKLKKVNDFIVKCNGEPIKPASSVKYIGVSLDQSLSGEHIANSIIKKTGDRLKFLYRQALFLNEKSRQILCSALIQCYFDYSCSSWFSALSTRLQNRLQVMQNKMVRFILNKNSRDHIGQKELDRLGLLNVKDRVTQLKLNHVYKIAHNTTPEYLTDNFTRVFERHTHNTRASEYNFVVSATSGLSSVTFYNTAIKHWNDLPSNIKSTTSLFLFKKLVKCHLSDQANSR